MKSKTKTGNVVKSSRWPARNRRSPSMISNLSPTQFTRDNPVTPAKFWVQRLVNQVLGDNTGPQVLWDKARG
jgi:hypothetical protein